MPLPLPLPLLNSPANDFYRGGRDMAPGTAQRGPYSLNLDSVKGSTNQHGRRIRNRAKKAELCGPNFYVTWLRRPVHAFMCTVHATFSHILINILSF